jgi:superfamily II DNA helicase RecQ
MSGARALQTPQDAVATTQVEFCQKEAAVETGLARVLASSYGYSNFRPQQLDAIKGTLRGEDVLLLLPTGGGKVSRAS